MKSIIIAQAYNAKRNANNSTDDQLERLRKYSQERGFEIIKEFSLSSKPYKKQIEAINDIVNTISSAQEQVAVCFDHETHLLFRVFNKQAYQLFDKAINGNIELHFISDGHIINADTSAADKFSFSVSHTLAKYYSDALSDNCKKAWEARRNGVSLQH